MSYFNFLIIFSWTNAGCYLGFFVQGLTNFPYLDRISAAIKTLRASYTRRLAFWISWFYNKYIITLCFDGIFPSSTNLTMRELATSLYVTFWYSLTMSATVAERFLNPFKQFFFVRALLSMSSDSSYYSSNYLNSIFKLGWSILIFTYELFVTDDFST